MENARRSVISPSTPESLKYKPFAARRTPRDKVGTVSSRNGHAQSQSDKEVCQNVWFVVDLIMSIEVEHVLTLYCMTFRPYVIYNLMLNLKLPFKLFSLDQLVK